MPKEKRTFRYWKPKLELETTTLWEYPSQHYGPGSQGNKNYSGATPSYVIWNVLTRYTRENDLVLDPMCGSGTTLDVCRDLGRKGLGFDIAPFREDIKKADARKIPLGKECVDFVFIDPPYSTHVHYSDDPLCIGKLDAQNPAYYKSLEKVFREIHRVLRNRRYMALFVCDSFKKGEPFCPIGFGLFSLLLLYFTPIDIIAVTRHNSTMKRFHWHRAAIEGNYFLRGFTYLIIMKKEEPEKSHRRSPKR
jgi:DNA modification methylase